MKLLVLSAVIAACAFAAHAGSVNIDGKHLTYPTGGVVTILGGSGTLFSLRVEVNGKKCYVTETSMGGDCNGVTLTDNPDASAGRIVQQSSGGCGSPNILGSSGPIVIEMSGSCNKP